MNVINRIVRAVRRLRLAMAESDLHWMEGRAPVAIAQQQARVAALRRSLAMSAPTPDSVDQIRHRIERQAKRVLL